MSERSTLWAPWRMEYILGAKGAGCVFCGPGDMPAERWRDGLVLHVATHTFVCLNRYPFAAGHLLVIPRRHVADVTELDDAEYEELMRLLRATVVRLRVATRAEGLNVGFNLGAAAGAGIAAHLHAHVVPRWHGDTNFMPVLADTHVMPQHLDATYDALAPRFADLARGAAGESVAPA